MLTVNVVLQFHARPIGRQCIDVMGLYQWPPRLLATRIGIET